MHQDIPGEMEVAADPNPFCSTSKTNTMSTVDRSYMEQLAYLQVKIARMMCCEAYLGRL